MKFNNQTLGELLLSCCLLVACQQSSLDKKTTQDSLISSVEDSNENKPQTLITAYEGQGFYKRLEGTLSNIPITMHLTKRVQNQDHFGRKEEYISGYYYYHKYQQPIALYQFTGEEATQKGSITLYENSQAHNSPSFVGKFIDETTFKGTWKNGDDKELPFELKEVYPSSSIRLNYFYAGDHLLEGSEEEPKITTCHYSMLYPTKELDSDQQLNLHWLIVPKIADEELAEQTENPLQILSQLRDEFVQGPKEDNDMTVERYMNVLWNRDGHLGFVTDEYTFTGGAHGNFGAAYYNYDLNNQRLIELADVFQDGYDNEIEFELEKATRQQHDIPKDAPFSDYFQLEYMYPTKNFLLTNKGILFSYVSYEIAPYSAGQVEVFVAFDQLEDVLQESFVKNWLP